MVESVVSWAILRKPLLFVVYLILVRYSSCVSAVSASSLKHIVNRVWMNWVYLLAEKFCQLLFMLQLGQNVWLSYKGWNIHRFSKLHPTQSNGCWVYLLNHGASGNQSTKFQPYVWKVNAPKLCYYPSKREICWKGHWKLWRVEFVWN